MSFRALQAELRRALGKIDAHTNPLPIRRTWSTDTVVRSARARHGVRAQKAGHPRDEERNEKHHPRDHAVVCCRFAWDRFLCRPQLERERQTQAQMHARQGPSQPAGKQAGNSRSAPRPQRASAAVQAGAGTRPAPRPWPKAQGSSSTRQPLRIDRAQGRAYRRRLVQGLSRDDRSEQPEHRPALAGRIRHALLRRGGLYRRTERESCAARAGYAVASRPRHADRTVACYADLRQRPRPRVPTQDRGRRPLHVHGDGQRREQVGAACHASSLCASSSARASPSLPAIPCLHEGFVGVIGDSGVQEMKYDKIEKEENATKIFRGHRRLDRLHRQILGRDRHSRSEQARRGQLSADRGGAPVIYQSGFVGTEGRRSRPALPSNSRPGSLPAPRKPIRSTNIRTISGSRNSIF